MGAMPKASPTPRQILNTPMGRNTAGAATIRGYLVALLDRLWREMDCFSVSNAFGEAGWDWELYAPLVRDGHIQGRFDADQILDQVDEKAGAELIAAAIEELGRAS
jgi:hypothetical protein